MAKLAPWNAGMLYRMRREAWASMQGNLTMADEMLFEGGLESLI